MSHRRQKTARRGQKRRAAQRLAGLATPEGLVVIDGRPYPLVTPHRDYSGAVDGHMEFDREMIRAGITAFVRPTMPSDSPDPSRIVAGEAEDLVTFGTPFTPPYMLVRSITPGVRSRIGIRLDTSQAHEPSAN